MADFTEDDVRLLADELEVLHKGPASFREDARTVLDFLADRGRLLPPDADQCEEWGALMRFNGRTIGLTRSDRETAALAARHHQPLPPVEMTGEIGKRTVWLGPWVPVGTEETPEDE